MTVKVKKKYIRPSRSKKILSPAQIAALQEPKGCRAIIPIDVKKEVKFNPLIGVDPRKSPNNWRYCQKPITSASWCCEEHRKAYYMEIPKKSVYALAKLAA